MPVVLCPNCPAKLKVPDGASGIVKCPKCGITFPMTTPDAPGFEVVAAQPAPGTQRPPVSPPVMKSGGPARTEPDSEIEDAKPKKRVVISLDDEDDEDDELRTKKKKQRDEDDEPSAKKKKKRYDDDDEDEDDEPRAKKKKKKRDEDEDEDDDEPRARKKKKRYDDDDEDEDDEPRAKKKKKKNRYDDDDWQPRPRVESAFANGKTGAMLLSISFWLNLGTFGLLALYSLILWVMVNVGSSSSSSRGGDGGGSFLNVLIILPGLIGLGSWIVGIVGLSFCIAGPKQARGMAITATVLASVHLLLVGVTFNNAQENLGVGIGRGFGLTRLAWIFVATALPFLDALFPMVFSDSSTAAQGEFIIGVLAAACEVLRLVFALATLKRMATAARDRYAAEKAQSGLVTALIVLGGVALVVLLMSVLTRESGFKSLTTILNLIAITLLMVYLAYTFMMLGPALAAMRTKDACDYRT